MNVAWRSCCSADGAERRDVVRGRERVGVLEVDLVLALGDLVVGGLDLEAHLL